VDISFDHWTPEQRAADDRRRAEWEAARAPKQARDMTDAEYKAARAAVTRPTRPALTASAPPPPPPVQVPGAQTGTTSSAAKAPPALAPTGQGRHARDMSPTEYAARRAELTRRPPVRWHGSR
jgi:hypothetical protein